MSTLLDLYPTPFDALSAYISMNIKERKNYFNRHITYSPKNANDLSSRERRAKIYGTFDFLSISREHYLRHILCYQDGDRTTYYIKRLVNENNYNMLFSLMWHFKFVGIDIKYYVDCDRFNDLAIPFGSNFIQCSVLGFRYETPLYSPFCKIIRSWCSGSWQEICRLTVMHYEDKEIFRLFKLAVTPQNLLEFFYHHDIKLYGNPEIFRTFYRKLNPYFVILNPVYKGDPYINRLAYPQILEKKDHTYCITMRPPGPISLWSKENHIFCPKQFKVEAKFMLLFWRRFKHVDKSILLNIIFHYMLYNAFKEERNTHCARIKNAMALIEKHSMGELSEKCFSKCLNYVQDARTMALQLVDLESGLYKANREEFINTVVARSINWKNIIAAGLHKDELARKNYIENHINSGRPVEELFSINLSRNNNKLKRSERKRERDF